VIINGNIKCEFKILVTTDRYVVLQVACQLCEVNTVSYNFPLIPPLVAATKGTNNLFQ